MQKLAPEVLIGMPTFIYHVLQAAVSHNLRCPQLVRIILGGEKAPSGMRRKLKGSRRATRRRSHVDVLMTYGFTEAKMAWPECPYPDGAASGGFHLYPDLGLIEIIDPKTGGRWEKAVPARSSSRRSTPAAGRSALSHRRPDRRRARL